jgi:hypothetical protein
VAENKIVPMYQKKQATAQQAEAVVNGHLEVPVFGQVKSPLRCG